MAVEREMIRVIFNASCTGKSETTFNHIKQTIRDVNKKHSVPANVFCPPKKFFVRCPQRLPPAQQKQLRVLLADGYFV